MKKTKNNIKREGEQPYIIGFITAMMVFLFFMMIGAWIMTVKDLSETAITILSYFIISLSSFIGSWTASRISKINGLKIGGTIGLGIFLVIFLIRTFVDGFSMNGWIVVKFILCTVPGMLGGIVGVNRADKRKLR